MNLTIRAFILYFVIVATANAASYDCSQKLNDIERHICKDSSLSLLDEKLARVYNELLSSLDNKKAKDALNNIQSNWLKFRNKKREWLTLKMHLEDAYDNQIQRIEYFLSIKNSDSSLNDPGYQDIFSLIVENNLPAPANVMKMGEGLYLLVIPGARPLEGIYGVNSKKKLLKRLTNGFPIKIIHTETERAPVRIVELTSYYQSISYTDIVAIYKTNNDLGIESKILRSFKEDNGVGGCGDSASNSLKVASILNNHTIENTKKGLVLTLEVTDIDCSLNTSEHHLKKYIFNKSGFKEY